MSQAVNKDYMRNKRIGEILVEKGVIQRHQLKRALEIQADEKIHIGKILVTEDFLRNRELHEAIAERFGLEFIDLLTDPPEYHLMTPNLRHEYFAMQAVPYRAEEGYITLATTGINDDLKIWAGKTYPGYQIKFVITSPYDISRILQHRFSEDNNDDARLKLWQQQPIYSARRLFHTRIPILIASLIPLSFVASVLVPNGFVTLITCMNILFFGAVTFKNILFMRGWRNKKDKKQDIGNFPVYTILLPLYKEVRTLPKLIQAMRNLDYPKTKLDIKFVVEADDILTINAIKRERPPQYMEIIAVPYSLPRTKPKACNYALNFARGEFVTIYDAEDSPDPGQLKTVLAKFNQQKKNIACVQARLNYFNYRDNILTRWFALEYAIWFDSVIKGLERLKMPIFLGGTSNHIRTSVLKQLGGWDAFNVTEDADIGMRLAQEGYITATVDSLTLEEAPNRLGAWAKQRTRWIKGFIQTYFVHMRDVPKLYRNIGFRGFVSLQFLIGIPILIYLSVPVIVGMSLMDIGQALPGWLKFFCGFNLGYGIASHISMCLLAARKARNSDGEKLFNNRMIFSAFTFYFYGILHMLAAFRALYQLITAPHYWDKTEHGLAKTGH